MGRKKLSMSEKIRRYAQAHPNAKPRDIAKVLGVKIALVYAVKYHKPVGVKVQPVAEVKVQEVEVQPVAEVKVQEVKVEADMVNHPPHYTDGGIETIDFLQAKLTREEFIGYLKGNALKYGSRLGKKGNPSDDAGKMAWYSMKLRDIYTQI